MNTLLLCSNAHNIIHALVSLTLNVRIYCNFTAKSFAPFELMVVSPSNEFSVVS